MTDATSVYVVWAVVLGAVSAVSLPLGSLVGLNVRFQPASQRGCRLDPLGGLCPATRRRGAGTCDSQSPR